MNLLGGTWFCLLICVTSPLNIIREFLEEPKTEEAASAATFTVHCSLFLLFNRCRLEVVPNSKKILSSFDSASPFMGRLPLNDSLYTINGIIHDFVIKNEKFLFLVLEMCFEIIHNGPSMF